MLAPGRRIQSHVDRYTPTAVPDRQAYDPGCHRPAVGHSGAILCAQNRTGTDCRYSVPYPGRFGHRFIGLRLRDSQLLGCLSVGPWLNPKTGWWLHGCHRSLLAPITVLILAGLSLVNSAIEAGPPFPVAGGLSVRNPGFTRTLALYVIFLAILSFSCFGYSIVTAVKRK
jgi:hypothetical protein